MHAMDKSMGLENLPLHVKGIDHVAIAVRDLETSVRFFESNFGFHVRERRTTRGEFSGMESAVLELGPVTAVFLQGTSERSQVSRFIARYGPGVQHLALRVEDIESVVGSLQRAGVEFATPILNAPLLRQVFCVRDADSGIMLEFIERSEDAGFQDQNVDSLFRWLEAKDAF